MNFIKESITDFCLFLKENKPVIYFILIFAVLGYGFEITNWTMSVDEELYVSTTRDIFVKLAIGDGRWGIGLLKMILPTFNTIPFWITILTVFFMACSAIIFVFIFNKYAKNLVASVLYCIIFISIPTHAYFIMFSSISMEISIGFVLLGFAVYLAIESIHKKNIKIFIASVIVLAFCISIYQAFILLYIQLVSSYLILNIITNTKEQYGFREWLKNCLLFILVLLASVIVYSLINKLSQALIYKSSYVSGYMGWKSKDFSTALNDIKYWLKQWYFKPYEVTIGGGIIIVSHIIYLISMLVILIKYPKKLPLFLITMIANILSIGLMIILMGNAMPIRTFLSVASYCGFSFYLLIILIKEVRLKKLSILVVLLAGIISLNQTTYVTKLFYSEFRRGESDLANAMILSNDIDKFIGEDSLNDVSVAIVGSRNVKKENFLTYEQFSWSYFEMGQGRIYKYLNVYGINYLKATQEQEEKAKEIAKTMPAWPLEGAIIRVGDLIVVNLQ